MTRVSDLEAIDQTLSDYYFSQAMDSVRDLLDGCVDGGRYVAPERRGPSVEAEPMTIETIGGERLTIHFEVDTSPIITQLRDVARRMLGTN